MRSPALRRVEWLSVWVVDQSVVCPMSRNPGLSPDAQPSEITRTCSVLSSLRFIGLDRTRTDTWNGQLPMSLNEIEIDVQGRVNWV